MTLAKILYASMTGNTKALSELLESDFREAGQEVVRMDVDDAPNDFLDDADIIVIATYSYGDGDLPLDFKEFYKELLTKDFTGKTFGVAATGSREYHAATFGQSADTFSAALKSIGATEGHPPIKIDGKPNVADEEVITDFVKGLLRSVQG